MHDLYGTLKSSRGINRRRARFFPNCYIPAARNCLTTSRGDPASLSVAAPPPAPTRVQHACNLYVANEPVTSGANSSPGVPATGVPASWPLNFTLARRRRTAEAVKQTTGVAANF